MGNGSNLCRVRISVPQVTLSFSVSVDDIHSGWDSLAGGGLCSCLLLRREHPNHEALS